MTDLWTAASYDAETEDMARRVTAARVSAVDVWPFLAGAENQADFENRKAIVADRLDAIVSSMHPNDPVGFSVVRASLEAALDEDFAVLAEQRQAEAATRARVEATLKAQAKTDLGELQSQAYDALGLKGWSTEEDRRKIIDWIKDHLGDATYSEAELDAATEENAHSAVKAYEEKSGKTSSRKVAWTDEDSGHETWYCWSCLYEFDATGTDAGHAPKCPKCGEVGADNGKGRTSAKTARHIGCDHKKGFCSEVMERAQHDDFSLSDAKNEDGEWIMSPEQIRSEMNYERDPGDMQDDWYVEGSRRTATRYCPTHKVYVGDGNQESHDHCPVETRKKKDASRKTAADSIECENCALHGMFYCQETVGTCDLCGQRADVFRYRPEGEAPETVCLDCLCSGKHMKSAHTDDWRDPRSAAKTASSIRDITCRACKHVWLDDRDMADNCPECGSTDLDKTLPRSESAKTAALPEQQQADPAATPKADAPATGQVERRVDLDPETGEYVGSEWTESPEKPGVLVQSDATFGKNPRFATEEEGNAWTAETGTEEPAEEEPAEVEDTTKTDPAKSNVPEQFQKKTTSRTAASDTGTCGVCGRATSYDRDSRKWTHDNEGSDTDHAVTKASAKTAASNPGRCDYCDEPVRQEGGAYVHTGTGLAEGPASGQFPAHQARPQSLPKPGEAGWETFRAGSRSRHPFARSAAPYGDDSVQWAANVPRQDFRREMTLPDGRTGLIDQNSDGTYRWGIRGNMVMDDGDGWPGAWKMDGTQQVGYPTWDAAFEAMVARAPDTAPGGKYAAKTAESGGYAQCPDCRAPFSAPTQAQADALVDEHLSKERRLGSLDDDEVVPDYTVTCPGCTRQIVPTGGPCPLCGWPDKENGRDHEPEPSFIDYLTHGLVPGGAFATRHQAYPSTRDTTDELDGRKPHGEQAGHTEPTTHRPHDFNSAPEEIRRQRPDNKYRNMSNEEYRAEKEREQAGNPYSSANPYGASRRLANPYSVSGNPYVAPMVTPGTPDDVLDGPANPNPPVLDMPMTTRPRQKPGGNAAIDANDPVVEPNHPTARRTR